MTESAASTSLTPPMFKEAFFPDWESLRNAVGTLADEGTWIFRGHRSSAWRLSSSLDRSGSLDRHRDEGMLLDRFIRHAPVHLPSHLVPGETKIASWLALMQHYGAPTRLLDFTWSPYVGLFFALEWPNPAGEHRALFAVHVDRCSSAMRPHTAQHLKTLNVSGSMTDAITAGDSEGLLRVLRAFPMRGTFPFEPWRFDARQTAQQSVFLAQASLDHSFEENISAWPCPDRTVIKLVFPDSLRIDVLAELARMNVTAASLFPGLDGYARSMHTYLTLREDDRRALLLAIRGNPLDE